VRRLASIAVALIVALAAPATALAAACPRTSVAALENEVMCQVCGVPLSLATDALQARRERAFIAQGVARCETKTQIKRDLVAQFGPSVLAEPPHSGFDASVYVVPVLAFTLAAGGLGWLGFAWRRRRRRDPVAAARPAALSAGDRARVDAALERWDL
jgi:cytochrome c-type biogenesis protein CcmH/NrfF